MKNDDFQLTDSSRFIHFFGPGNMFTEICTEQYKRKRYKILFLFI